MTTSVTKHPGREAGLDALRAVAILLVIPRHAWELLKWPWLKPFFGRHGWIGVELFFVLSGFLIGTQLLRQVRRDGRVRFGEFYLKRTLRILPCYLAVLALYLVWPAFREAPVLDPAWRFLSFVMNYGRQGEAFSHAWSLCIEEHFYLAFPLLVAVYASRRILLRPAVLFALVIVGGMVARYYLWSQHAHLYIAVYRKTHTHLDGLTVGVGLALLREHRPEAWKRLVAHPWALLVGGTLAVAAGSWLWQDARDASAWVLTLPLLGLGFGAMVAAAVAPRFWLSERQIPGAATVATLAYTLYLTHKQMIHLARTLVSGEPAIVALGVVFIALGAVILHVVVEKPLLAWRARLLA